MRGNEKKKELCWRRKEPFEEINYPRTERSSVCVTLERNNWYPPPVQWETDLGTQGIRRHILSCRPSFYACGFYLAFLATYKYYNRKYKNCFITQGLPCKWPLKSDGITKQWNPN